MNRHVATKPAQFVDTTTHTENGRHAAETNGIHLPLSMEARDALHREALALRRQAIRDAGTALAQTLLTAWGRLRRGLRGQPGAPRGRIWSH